ncbi:hypothetical protein SDRG_16882 [Saprolegnia diclina VS20]|uniref:Uncharacterized protein n=1 Tax=Saprolegnia diclina (strain VS20) TaxID=1156394 RepID=T0PIN8_SAPDV|nr:hypothetical protein SDRG_16882 [Saprolegnia diclina VS20]EQC25244.1 hypothetical protein SDRG_16882 [Saprolegnia diclina VS20]|eukprot:XP_008621328.1 hypothetical protein SDRG_16882 [Saprolegnia diclina VS20]
MPPIKVFVGAGYAPQPRHVVRRNRFAFGVSMGILLNIALMPIKAYLSEDLPWTRLQQVPASTNFTEFNTSTLVVFQAAYNAQTLPAGTAFINDNAHSVQLVREVLNIASHTPVGADDCQNAFLLGKPGVLYYPDSIRDLLCDLAAQNASFVNITAWHNRGTCVYNTYFSLYIGHQCVWITAGNALTPIPMRGNEVTITAATGAYASIPWLWVKFVFRLVMTLISLRLMWTKYYRHVLALERLLAERGHRPDTKALWHYEVIWGDPTAMILMDPSIATIFAIDFWLSVDVVTLAIMRASQSEDIPVMLLGFLYLSRTPTRRCALTDKRLKRLKTEHTFVDVDPTLVAIAATLYGPMVAWTVGNVGFALVVFHFLFELTVPSALVYVRFDGCLASTLYTLILAIMPVLYGFGMGLVRKAPTIHRDMTSFSSFKFNNIRTRVLFAAMQVLEGRVPPGVASFGGTMYRLFEINPRYKLCPTISFRSTDCFVYCYEGDAFKEKLRLGLLSCLDRILHEPAVAISDARDASPFAFNQLQMPSEKQPTPTLRLPSAPTVWCL